MIDFIDQYKSASNWKERALTINKFHKLSVAEYDHWFIKDTAGHFNISVGLVCEDIKLAEQLIRESRSEEVRIGNCKTRKDALALIRRKL